MRCAHHKANDSTAISRRSKAVQSRHIGHSLQRITSKIDIVLKNFGASNSFEVIDRSRETDGAGNIWRACFETVRRFFERAVFQRNTRNHLAPAMPRLNRIENVRSTIEHADSGARAHVVTGESENVAAVLLHLERHEPETLRRNDE